MNNSVIINKMENTVTKICDNHQKYLKEIEIYKMKLSFVPELLKKDGKNSFTMKYINGKTIGEISNPDFAKLGEIYAELHSHKNEKYFSICHSDNNPKNYLVDADDKYFMIDFSDWIYDFPEKDVIRFFLFWASIFSQNRLNESIKTFLKVYQQKSTLEKTIWISSFQSIENEFDERRKKFHKKEILATEIIRTNRMLLRETLLK
jgi:tRNA A-37 threonylcarbamoyl transferase component Bud32